MDDNQKTNTPEHVNSPGRWRMIWPVFVCTSAFVAAIDSPVEISLKNLPNLAVMFFVVLLIAFVFWAILYAIDSFFLGRLELWISEKLGTNSRWKKAVGFLMKLAVLFVAMIAMFAFVNGFHLEAEQTENYRLGYEAGYDAAWMEHRDDYDLGYETGYEDGVSAASWERADIQDLLDEAEQEGFERGYEDAWYDMEHGNPNMMETDSSDYQWEGPIPSDIGG